MDTKVKLDEHLESCMFEKVKAVLQEREQLIESLQQENKSAREDIDFLYTSLRGLNERCDSLEAEKDRKLNP